MDGDAKIEVTDTVPLVNINEFVVNKGRVPILFSKTIVQEYPRIIEPVLVTETTPMDSNVSS